MGLRSLALLAIAGGLAGCAGLAPMQVVDRGRDACRDELQDEDYDNIDIGSAQRGDRRVVYSVRAQHDDEAYGGLCIYDSEDGDVNLDLAQTGDAGWIDANARELCVEEARDRGFDVRSVRDVDVQDEDVRIDLYLERNGRTFDGRCDYDRDNGDIDLDTDRASLF